MVSQSAQGGPPDGPCDQFGYLILLDDNGETENKFWIRKKSISLGRAMTNDVRLLLGDVSRLHARLCFDENGHASFEVLGTNGLWHNDKFIQPDSPPTPWPLSEGDVLRISQHKLSFSYTCAAKEEKSAGAHEMQQAVPEPAAQPSSRSATPRFDGETAKQATPTPTRRSARLKARASMPSLRHGWTPEKELRPVPLTQQPTTSVQHRLDLASPSVGRPKLCHQERLPEETSQETVGEHGHTPTKEALASHDTHSSPAVMPTKQDDLSQEMDLSSTDVTSKETEQDDLDETATMESVELSRMEAALWESELISEPTGSSSPASTGSRYSMAERQPRSHAPPLAWSPSKTRKVSLRTATLLKRSAQLPILPIPETTRRTPSPARFAEPASSGSQDMDISSTLPRQESGDSSDDESEVEQSLEMQVHEEAQVVPQSITDTRHEAYANPRPLSQTFLTPQVEKARNPAHRRLSFEPQRSSASGPALKHKSSWQWLKGILSPGKQGSRAADQESVPKPEPDEPQDTMTHEERGPDAAHVQLTEESDKDEFFDTDDEMPDKIENVDANAVQDNGTPVLSSPLSYPTELPVPHALETPSNLGAINVLPTPDMHMLKHMFAEPKPTMTAESTVADFRHLVYKDERQARMAPDMSLGGPLAALEMDAHESTESAQSIPDMCNKDQPQAAVNKHSPYMPVPLNRLATQQKSRQDTAQRVSTELGPLTERPVRSMTRKEPYVPVRRQLPQRNAVKTSRIGSLSTTATRISAGAARDSKENLRKADVKAMTPPVHSARSTADGIKTTSLPMAKPAGTKNSSTTLTHQYRRPIRTMKSRTNLHTHDK